MTKEVINEPTPTTDVGNGMRFAKQHGHKVKFIHAWHKWVVNNNRYWEVDPCGTVQALAKETAQSILVEASQFADVDEAKKYSRWAIQSQSSFRIAAMLDMAKSEQPIPLDYKTLDSDGWQLNCDNGTIDLQTGRLGKHRPEDFITMTTGVEFPGTDAKCPRWQSFLSDIFDGNDSMIRYVQRLCGLSLVGQVVEHILPMAIGTGCNGKSVFCETVRAVMGDYAMSAPHGMLMSRRHQSHSTELADLFRKRLVIVSETNDGSRLDEGLVKSLTGGDSIRARRMREDHWQFEPTHTLFLVTNHKPIVKGRDVGIWRRIRLIPFNTQIAVDKQDPHLTEKLKAEHPAILAWMVQGCVDWQCDGLQEPDEVRLATEEYKADQDVLGVFVDECCMVGESFRVQASRLYEGYRKWNDSAGEKLETQRAFGSKMTERGFERIRSNGVWYKGLTLND